MQLTYSQYQDPLQLGNIADTALRQIDSYSAENAIGIAKAVVRGTNKERQVLAAGTGAGQAALVIGISILSQTIEQTTAGAVLYNTKETVPVMRKGRVVVQANDAVTAGAIANFHMATGNFTDEAVAAGIEAFVLVQVRFVTGTTAAGLAIVEINNIA